MRSARLLSRLEAIDWDFSGAYSESPFSALHWYPGRFASQIPAALIGVLSSPEDVVFDPFCGVGTTLIEAQRLGRRSIGIELSPVAVHAARAKTLRSDAARIGRIVDTLKEAARDVLSSQPRFGSVRNITEHIPAGVQATKWYSPKVRSALATLWALLRRFRGDARILGLAAFSATLLPVCRETRHWGYVCDNTEPQTDNQGDVLEEYCHVLDELSAAYELRDAERRATTTAPSTPVATVFWGDVRDQLSNVPKLSIDLVVTSPPYFGVVDYVKSQRLMMEWIGSDIEPYRLKEIGARSKRHRHNSDAQYLSELEESFAQIGEKLKRGAYCAIILGQSGSRRSVLDDATQAIQRAGLRLVLDKNRSVSSQRRQIPSILSEHLLVFRK